MNSESKLYKLHNEKLYKFQDFHIPEYMMDSIKRYIEDGIQPGSFLTAVIQNNFSQACFRADDENIHNLPAYAAYFYNEVSFESWGSKEKMEKWIKKFVQ